jgi:hypothetical protein
MTIEIQDCRSRGMAAMRIVHLSPRCVLRLFSLRTMLLCPSSTNTFHSYCLDDGKVHGVHGAQASYIMLPPFYISTFLCQVTPSESFVDLLQETLSEGASMRPLDEMGLPFNPTHSHHTSA